MPPCFGVSLGRRRRGESQQDCHARPRTIVTFPPPLPVRFGRRRCREVGFTAESSSRVTSHRRGVSRRARECPFGRPGPAGAQATPNNKRVAFGICLLPPWPVTVMARLIRIGIKITLGRSRDCPFPSSSGLTRGSVSARRAAGIEAVHVSADPRVKPEDDGKGRIVSWSRLIVMPMRLVRAAWTSFVRRRVPRTCRGMTLI